MQLSGLQQELDSVAQPPSAVCSGIAQPRAAGPHETTSDNCSDTDVGSLTTTTTDSDTPASPAATSRFRIGEMDVSLASELPEIMEDFEALYGSCRLEGDPPEDAIRLEVRRGKRSLFRGTEYEILGDGEGLWTTRRRNEVFPYVEWGLNWRVINTRSDYLQVHAASMTRAGQGVILAGKAGSGKSTLAAGLMSRGWGYLSDEFALIHPDSLRVHPFPKPVCIKHGSFDVVERLDLPLLRHRHYVKVLKGRVGYLSPYQLGPEAVGEPSPVRHIVFPTYADDTTPRLHEMSRAEAVFLLTEVAFNRNVFGPRAATVLSELVRGAECYRLDAGPIEETCDLLESLTERDCPLPSRCP